MASRAIRRCLEHSMAVHAETHVQSFFAHRNGSLPHVPVTRCAIDARADVRSMPELHMYRRVEPENALPGNQLTFFLIGSHFLDFRLVGCNHLVAGHTELNIGNGSVRAVSHSLVAVCTLHAILQMYLVSEGDRLLDVGRVLIKVVSGRFLHAGVSNGELSRGRI